MTLHAASVSFACGAHEVLRISIAMGSSRRWLPPATSRAASWASSPTNAIAPVTATADAASAAATASAARAAATRGTHETLLARGGRYADFWHERTRAHGWRLAPSPELPASDPGPG